ncbi:alpha/beta fold hydrolase [Saccharopolyspora sp. NFXS83]|uniref:alpha/beta fold hydrolase n=1 Tax=Saccharopolyspora sp. NFXS83 TaxID=2993560 RepID=UPI00224B1D07|nr:alpha/beta fold hydrolase [Saccharopolyspora sp. NFXS83]MCX2731886.1 alpha/beta fold hydrolase [Saccharopolyspora sp. NFXS83]
MVRSSWSEAGGSGPLLLSCVVVVLLLVGAGFGVARVDSGVVRTTTVADGVPIDLVRPADMSAEKAPAVIVAHGYAGSRRLMADWGTTLARSGFVVALPDFAGHGANRTPLPEGSARESRLAADLTATVGLLRRTPEVDPDRIGLAGHSMGAGAVHRFASEHPEIAATVAISLPGGGDSLQDPALPKDLLLLTGQYEFPAFHRAAEDALRAGYPDSVRGSPNGDPALGNARQGRTVEHAEHITILFAPRAHAEAARWLRASLHGTAAPDGNAAGERVLAAALLWGAFAVGFLPFVRKLFRPAPPGTARAGASARIAGAVAAGTVLAVTGSALVPTGWSPLAVGGEVGWFLALFGLGSGLAFALLAPDSVHRGRGFAPWRSSAVTSYAVLAVAVPIGFGLAEPIPHGPRWWWTPLVVAGCGIACAAAELLARGLHGRRRDGVRAAVLCTALLGIGAAAVAGVLPSFVLLIAPLLGALLLWHLAWAAVLARSGAPWWLPAVVGGVLLGLPPAAVSPLM